MQQAEWREACVAAKSMETSIFFGHKAAGIGLCYDVCRINKQGLGQTQRFVGSRKGTTDSEKDIFGENSRWECHWHGVIAWVEDDSTWAKHPKDQGMVRRMRGEPNIGTRVCVKEKEVMALIWLCVEEVMADVVTLPTRMSRFLDGGGLSPP